MANVAISGLPAVTTLANTDLLAAVASNVTSKITIASMNTVVKPTQIINGNSNVTVAANSTVSISATGVANVATFTNNTATLHYAVAMPNIAEDTTGNSVLVLRNNSTGDIGYDSTIYYDHSNEELHVGNLVLNDNVTGATIGLDEQDQDMQFTVNQGGTTQEVFRLIGATGVVKLFPHSGTPPTASIGAFYFNNDAGELSGVGLYFCANTSLGNGGWQQVNLT